MPEVTKEELKKRIEVIRRRRSAKEYEKFRTRYFCEPKPQIPKECQPNPIKRALGVVSPTNVTPQFEYDYERYLISLRKLNKSQWKQFKRLEKNIENTRRRTKQTTTRSS